MTNEALPTLYIQIDALSKASEAYADDLLPKLSIGLSLLMISWVISSIQFDQDISPRNRSVDSYSGVIDKNRQALGFISLMIRCFTQLSTRLIIFYVFNVADKMPWFFVLLAGEVRYKARARGDDGSETIVDPQYSDFSCFCDNTRAR